ncbi:MAG: helix-turn-helix transcriptional regulator [Sulfobacillus sp.]
MTIDMPHPHIREAREQAGLTQEALAERLGVTRKTVWNLETGRTLPNLAVVFALAAILGVVWSTLYDEKGTSVNE